MVQCIQNEKEYFKQNQKSSKWNIKYTKIDYEIKNEVGSLITLSWLIGNLIKLFITKHSGTGANGDLLKGNKEKDRTY